MWDGRAPTLEAQAKGPIQSTVEMNQKADELIDELKTIRNMGRCSPGYSVIRESLSTILPSYCHVRTIRGLQKLRL